jgi:hypothetical protein
VGFGGEVLSGPEVCVGGVTVITGGVFTGGGVFGENGVMGLNGEFGEDELDDEELDEEELDGDTGGVSPSELPPSGPCRLLRRRGGKFLVRGRLSWMLCRFEVPIWLINCSFCC